jgi:hypothetical protein
MCHNYFQSGDTFWLQKNGTAMGTPPVCAYATLYFGIWEIKILPLFADSLPYYHHYIDDCFGIWSRHNDPAIDAANWMGFQASMGAYGKLEWEFTDRSKVMHFLDLDLQITLQGIHTVIFKK